MDSLIVSHVLLKPIDIDSLRRKLKREFKLDGFGRINRIDILSINKDGFAEIKVGFRCTKKKDILELRDTVYYQICEQPVRMNLSDEVHEGYWILSLKCLPSHNQWSDLGIPDIKLNHSTDQVDTQKAISEADILQKIDELEDKVKRQQDVIYQLLGGLFNHDTQKGSVDELVSVLLKIQPLDLLKDTSKWTIYPTTRQGDDNERRIDELEKKLGDFGTLFPQKITEERQSVSFDLCGNA